MTEFRAVATDDFRRKWDKKEWDEKARKEREEESGDKKSANKARGRKRKHGHHGAERADVCSDYESDNNSEKEDPDAPREPLRPREYKVDLESRVGKSFVVTKSAPLVQQAGSGYYCDVCDCVVKDSTNFLDHINGRKHQRNLGMSMKVSRSTVDDVRKRLGSLKQQRDTEKREYNLEERLKEIREEELRAKVARKEKRKEKKGGPSTSNADDADLDDPQLASIMGFSAFSTGKKK